MEAQLTKLELVKLITAMESMNEKELESAHLFLGMIGIDGKKIEKIRGEIKNKARVLTESLPEEYDMVVLVKCQTCGTKEELFFGMRRNLAQWGLVSTPLEERPKVFRFRKEVIDSCRFCKEKLNELTKDEIVDIIFGTINRFNEKIRTLMDISL